MARLRIYKSGAMVQDLQLDPSQTYLAGRAESCQIKLDSEVGISRQHFQLTNGQGSWHLEVLSRYGELYVRGAKSPGLALAEGLEFEVPPYRFVYKEQNLTSISNTQDSNDATAIAVLPSAAYVRVLDERGQVKNIYRLDGEAWTAGRDMSCALHIDNAKVSRRQFEIYREGPLYFARDLGSSNGTAVNGHRISKDEWTQLQSGDSISVIDWVLKFEIRDASFQQRVENLPPDLQAQVVNDDRAGGPAGDDAGTHYGPSSYEPPPAESWQQAPPGPDFQSEFQTPPQQQYPMPPPAPAEYGNQIPLPQTKKKLITPIRVIFLAMLIGIGYFAMMDDKPVQKMEVKNPKTKAPFDALSATDQQIVIRAYNNSKQDLMSQNYLEAIQEITRLKEKVPYYEDSREIEKYANEGLARADQLKNEEKLEQSKLEMEAKIQKQVALCKKKINPKTVDIPTVDACLSDVLGLSPDHPAIQALHQQVDNMVTSRTTAAAKRAAYSSEVRQLQGLYDHAHGLMKQGKYMDGLDALVVVTHSKLPDPQGLKAKAQAEHDDYLSNRAHEQSVLEDQADQLLKDGKVREAIIALQKALKINPDNEVTKGHLLSAMTELRKSMQTIYQESIVEESVGDVDTAKTKWRKIIDQSVPTEPYYEKAVVKLKKYGFM